MCIIWLDGFFRKLNEIFGYDMEAWKPSGSNLNHRVGDRVTFPEGLKTESHEKTFPERSSVMAPNNLQHGPQFPATVEPSSCFRPEPKIHLKTLAQAFVQYLFCQLLD